MRILCFIDSLCSGGAQRQMVELAKGFKDKGHFVLFLVYHNDNFFLTELVNYNIEVKLIQEQNLIRRIIKIRREIRVEEPDILLSFLEAPNFIATLSGLPYKNWKLIVGERSANPNILKSPKLIGFRFFHILSNYVVANSMENAKIIKRVNPLLSDKKIKVIYNIVGQQFTADFNVPHLPPKNKLHVLVASSHQYLKNSLGIIQALKLLNPNELNSIQINWFGEVRDNSYYELKKEIILNNFEDVFKLYSATPNINNIIMEMDVIGIFSFYEGFPNILCEAMAMGKPVISSNISDLSLIINEQYLFDPNNPSSIADVFRYILALSKKELSENGELNKLRSKNLFDKNNNVSQYLELFKN